MNAEEEEELQNEQDEILDNLSKILEKDEFEDLKSRFETQLNLFPESTKLISCPHEIVFSVTANVLEENAEGKSMGSSELLTRTYHMPVPKDKHYGEFIDAFLEFFERTLSESYQSAEKDTQSRN